MAQSTGEKAGGRSLDETQLPGAAAQASVRVFVRLRPPDEEGDVEMFEFPQHRRGKVTIKDPLSAGRSEHSYEFNDIFQSDQNQEQLFTPVAGPIVEAATQGHSGCILAYGQTGSGKTYSMFGEGHGPGRGLLPRAAEQLFEKMHQLADTTIREPSGITSGMSSSNLGLRPRLAVSFLEVYLDRIHDIGRLCVEDEEELSRSRKVGSRTALSSFAVSSASGTHRGQTGGLGNTSKESLDVREGPSGMVEVRGLSRLPVQDFPEVKEIIDRGLSRRATARTGSNAQSSRSHTIFTIYLPRQPDPRAPPTDDSECEFANSVTLSFVDLAGSERLAKSKAEGARFQEAVSINSSLTALGKVILALAADPGPVRHVPYRDSKLTRILSPSFALGGNVALLATLHPRMEDYEECLHTLAWAHRCKNVQKQQPQVTYISQKKNSQVRIHGLELQIASLKEQIKEVRAAIGVRMSNCGISGIGASGQVDEVEMQIAKVIIGDRKNSKPDQDAQSKGSGTGAQSSRVPSGAATPLPAPGTSVSDRLWAESEARDKREATAREASIAALVALQEERGRQAQAHEKAQERMLMLDKEHVRLAELEAKRAISTEELQRQGAELQDDLTLVQEKRQRVLETQSKSHGKALEELKGSTERRLSDVDNTLLRMPAQIKMKQEIADKKRLLFEESRKATAQEHIEVVRKMKAEHAKELKELTLQWRAQINEKDVSNAESAKELTEIRKNQADLAAKCQAEHLSLYELIVKFAKLAADVDDGKHPAVWRAGLREAVLPEGIRPTPPSLEMYPQLFDAIAREEEKPSSLERAAQRPPSSGRARRAGAGGIAAVAAAEAMRESAGLETMSADWHAAPVVRALCDSEHELDAESTLAKLSAAQLRHLCVALRDHSLELFAPGEEREALHNIALNALKDGSTDDYIRDLEERRSTEQAALSDVVDRASQLRNWLSSRKGSLNVTPAITPVGGRSRPITPIGGRSRPSTAGRSGSGSRPTTAPSSRPPLQLGYPAPPGYPPLPIH